MHRPLTLGLALASLLPLAVPTLADDRTPSGGRINNLKVLSDKIDDVTTVENVLASFAKPGMSDQERAQALWTAAIRYRHQSVPPNEFLAADWEVHDPIKLFNVYGYCMCCCSSALIEALNRLDGREARGRILNGHSVPEVRYGAGWHMFDASLITFYPRPADGVAASVDEIAEAVADWYAKHPGSRNDRAQLDEVMRSDGWMGWKARGPALLANCPYYRLGFFPAGTHGWNDTMGEYDRKPEVYEYGYHVGHRALFSLRPGESFVREAGNRGLHVNMERDPRWDGLNARAPERDLVYLKEFLPGYRGGIVGNGTHRYAPGLARGGLSLGAEVFDNLASGGSPALRRAEAGRPGVVVIPMISPYVYLGGKLRLKALRASERDRVAVSISTDNGRHYTPLWAADTIGASEAVVDLKEWVIRRYAYWLKVEIESNSTEGTGLDAFEVENDFQHAPRTLPWLGKGRNTIRVAADGDPGLASRAIACRITADEHFTANETARGMGVTVENLDLKHESYWWKGGTGTLTIPVEVPGDLVALRFSAQIRARGEKDLIRMAVSGDDGASWREAGRTAGPSQGKTGAFRVDVWPGGTRKALLRFTLTGNNTVGILSFRVDADYRDPLATPTTRPFRVIHRWREEGRDREHVETIAALPHSYAITTDDDPEMVSVTSEMPGAP